MAVEMPADTCPVVVHNGDCLEVLRAMPDGSVDAVVTDPPYGLVEPRAVDGFGSMQRRGGTRTDDEKARHRGGFMGKAWDSGVPGVEFWVEAWRVLRPGGYLLAFGGTRTYHRLACAVEDAGFEVRDCLMWLYGTGFPKGKGCLKPAWEPILLARKPGPRVMPLGIDGCRIPAPPWLKQDGAGGHGFKTGKFMGGPGAGETADVGRLRESSAGRYPANVLHDGSDEVAEAFAAFGEKTRGAWDGNRTVSKFQGVYQPFKGKRENARAGDTGTAARFFYCAKASKRERGEGNTHPTVKPLALMQWLVRLVAGPGEVVLDPFAGSGTTGLACLAEGRRAVLVEREPVYCDVIRKRLAHASGAAPGSLFAGVV